MSARWHERCEWFPVRPARLVGVGKAGDLIPVASTRGPPALAPERKSNTVDRDRTGRQRTYTQRGSDVQPSESRVCRMRRPRNCASVSPRYLGASPDASEYPHWAETGMVMGLGRMYDRPSHQDQPSSAPQDVSARPDTRRQVRKHDEVVQGRGAQCFRAMPPSLLPR